jgi:SagB-type dehydrogenase family enzyme
MKGLGAGVYHFCPADFALTELRKGDCRAELAASIGGNDDFIMSAPVTLAFTSIAWRNAWKYQTRSYRHWFWDAGVIAANLLATTASLGLPTRLSMGLADAEVNRFLYLEEGKEAAVAIATIGIGPAAMESRTEEASIAPHNNDDSKTTATVAYPEILPLSKTEIEYPEIWEMHAASSLASREQAGAWVNSAAKLKKLGGSAKGESSKNFLLPQPSSRELSAGTKREEDTLGRVILRRGSTRRFARSGISLTTLSTILHSSTSGIPLDFLQDGETIIQIYLAANAVDSLHPGRYFFNCAEGCLEQLEKQEDGESRSRSMSQYLCLGQSLFGDASAVFFLMCDLQKVLNVLGNRGYGAAQFEAGIIAGKIYLAAYAQGIGASGSTFYDDAVTEFFSPHAGGKSAMIAVGVGVPAYRARPGKVFAGTHTRAELLSSSPEGLA